MSCPIVSEHNLFQLDQPLQEWDVMKLHFLSIVVPSFFTERKTVAPLGHRSGVEQAVLCSQLPKLPTHPLPSTQEPAQGLVFDLVSTFCRAYVCFGETYSLNSPFFYLPQHIPPIPLENNTRY